MPRVYVMDGVEAPETDGLGGYYCVETIPELRALVSRLGLLVKEIMINGTPTTPPNSVVHMLGVQMVKADDAWGVRNRRFFYCRGTSLADVLRVRDQLAHH